MTLVLGYLSGAMRVNTHASGEPGPRSHVLGVIDGFGKLGWDVQRFIAGDLYVSHQQLGRQFADGQASYLRRLAGDVVRLTLDRRHRRLAAAALTSPTWVYERLAIFQGLGRRWQRAGIPWIIETQGPMAPEAAADRNSLVLVSSARAREQAAYRDCAVIVAVSPAAKARICELYAIDPAKIIIIPNGVDTTDFVPVPPAAPLGAELVIGFVGSLLAWQNLDLLLRAIAALDARGVRVHLRAAGSGAMSGEWTALARELGIADRVQFAGRIGRPEVPGFLAGCHIGFSGQKPTRNGDMYHSPLKIYEYLACGKPFLGSLYPDAISAADPANREFLFDPLSLDDLVRAVGAAVTRREELAAIGARHRERAVQEHSWTARVRDTIVGVNALLPAGQRVAI